MSTFIFAHGEQDVHAQGGAMKFFSDLSELRQNAADVSHFPHRQLASKVLSMVNETYMTNRHEPIRLRPDVSPEMLEACLSRIFGKTAMTAAVSLLPEIGKRHADDDEDDMYSLFIGERKLLADTAEKSAWGTPSTDDANRIAFLIFCLVGCGDLSNRFVAQAKKRIEMVH